MKPQKPTHGPPAKNDLHDIRGLASNEHEDWVPISPAGTEGCLWEEDHFDYEALMKNVP